MDPCIDLGQQARSLSARISQMAGLFARSEGTLVPRELRFQPYSGLRLRPSSASASETGASVAIPIGPRPWRRSSAVGRPLNPPRSSASGRRRWAWAYRDGRDTHRLTARLILGKLLEDATKDKRQLAKAVLPSAPPRMLATQTVR
jgi:hypothetical protein